MTYQTCVPYDAEAEDLERGFSRENDQKYKIGNWQQGFQFGIHVVMLHCKEHRVQQNGHADRVPKPD